MEIAASNIVRSVAGRDQGKLFIVLAVEGEYLLLADGKSRKVESPKRKKRTAWLQYNRTLFFWKDSPFTFISSSSPIPPLKAGTPPDPAAHHASILFSSYPLL